MSTAPNSTAPNVIRVLISMLYALMYRDQVHNEDLLIYVYRHLDIQLLYLCCCVPLEPSSPALSKCGKYGRGREGEKREMGGGLGGECRSTPALSYDASHCNLINQRIVYR